MHPDRWRLPLIVSLVGIVGIILAVHTTGRFFPWSITAFFVTMSLLLGLAVRGHSLYGILAGSVLVGMTYRLAFNFYTATPVGLTPQAYPARYDRLIEAGRLTGGYYATPAGAPFQDLLFMSSGIVGGFNGYYTIFLYAILVPVLYPLFAVAILTKLEINDHRILGSVVVLVLVTTEGLRRTYYPRNQMIAVLFFLGAVYILIPYLRRPTGRRFGLLGMFALAMAFSHRLPLAIMSAILAGLIFLYLFDLITWENVKGWKPIYQIGSIFVIVATFTTIQLFYLGNTFNHLVRRVIRILTQIQFEDGRITFSLQSTGSGGGGGTEIAAAESALPGLIANYYQYPSEFALFVERGHGIWLLLLAGLAWAYTFFRVREPHQRGPVLIILAVSSVCVSVMFFGVISIRGMNPTRPLHLVEPILIILIGIAVWKSNSLDKSRLFRICITLILIILIAGQVFAMPAAPDYTNSPRYYGDASEVTAKETVVEYSPGPVYSDTDLSRVAGIRGDDRTTTSRLGGGESSPLLNAEINPDNHSTVLYRPHYDVYHGRFDRYRLTWDPEKELGSTYNRVYDNKDVVGFSSTQ